MSERPSIDQIKSKIKAERDAEAVALAALENKSKDKKTAPIQRTLTPEVANQIAEYQQAVQELNTEEEVKKIDLGPTPEGVSETPPVDPYADDNMFYRGTPSDNSEVRKHIEDNCESMDFADLIITGRVGQTTPIMDGKLIVVFKSLLASENFWIEKNAQQHATTDWAMRSWMGYARLTMSLESVNGRDFTGYSDGSNEVDDQQFSKRFREVMQMGEKLIELLLINLNWFNDRVENLYKHDFEKLKNG